MTLKTVRFNTKDKPEFYKVLRKRVNNYFKENNISKFANARMKWKTAIILIAFFTPLVLLVTGLVPNPYIQVLLWIFMGVGMAGVGLTIMHDANHGSYSKNQMVNKLLGMTINFAGGYALNWKIQHNVLHHTYTNVSDLDQDIDTGKLMRFSPRQPHFKFQKFQIIYAWFFYGIMTFYWVVGKDFVQIASFKKDELLKAQGKSLGMALLEIFAVKIVYLFIFAFLPLYFMDISFGFWFLCFFSKHFVAGLILAIVFQPAHVIEDTEFPEPDLEGSLENNWAIHQFKTTANFAPKNKILGWYMGGLNYQVEHHLFPTICHIHYPKISKIVKATCEEYGVPYYSKDTFTDAVVSHVKLLARLGKGESVAPVSAK
ncbi:acyl-CoA desaturase [Flavobacteriales bacterium]|nr:acyl-CoA desaturase [Flavobacteriales bacterium]